MSYKPIVTTVEEFESLAERRPRSFGFAGVKFREGLAEEILASRSDLAWRAAEMPQLSAEVLERLARWPDPQVRQAVVGRLHVFGLDSRILANLETDLNSRVREKTLDPNRPVERQARIVAASTGDGGELHSRSRLKTTFGIHWQDLTSVRQVEKLWPYRPSAHNAFSLPDQDMSREDRRAWIRNSGYTTNEEFARLLNSDDSDQRELAARSRFCPTSILASLALDPDSHVRRAAMRNESANIPMRLLARLDSWWHPGESRDESSLWGLRANHLKMPTEPSPESFEVIDDPSELSESDRSVDSRLRRLFSLIDATLLEKVDPLSPEAVAAIRNRQTPDRTAFNLILERVRSKRMGEVIGDHPVLIMPSLLGRPILASLLASIDDYNIQLFVSRSSHTPVEVRRSLLESPLLYSYDKDSIRRSISLTKSRARQTRNWQKSLDSETFDQFRLTSWSSIRSFTNSHLSTTNESWRQIVVERPDLAKWIAINETVGPRLLDELADWPDPEVRGWVADHRRVWIKTLIRLANDPDPDVRRYATYNAKMPDAQLRKLVRDPETATREEAQRRLEVRAFADRLLHDPEWWRYLGNSPF